MMAYQVNIQKAADWIDSIQNVDGGWGLTAGQVSSMVNTAEALFVLDCAGQGGGDKAVKGLDFLKQNFDQHISQRGQKTRFAAFPLYVIATRYPDFDRRFQRKLLKWLVDAVCGDGGWPAEVGQSSDLYSTYLCILAVNALDPRNAALPNAKNWVLSQAQARGWSLDQSGAAPLSATAYALVALHALGETSHGAIERGLELLNGVSHWGDEEAPLSGTLWKHSTHSNVLSALACHSDDIFNNQIADGIRYSNRLISPTGGWMENDSPLDNKTVRAQYWSAAYSELLIQRFDPSKFVLRVDGERQAGTLKAPDFQHFLINTKFATVIPKLVVRLVVYLLLIIGASLSLFASKAMAKVPPTFWQIAALTLISIAFFIIIKRKSIFPKVGIIAPSVLALLSLLDLVFGISVIDLFDIIRNIIRSIGSYLQTI